MTISIHLIVFRLAKTAHWIQIFCVIIHIQYNNISTLLFSIQRTLTNIRILFIKEMFGMVAKVVTVRCYSKLKIHTS